MITRRTLLTASAALATPAAWAPARAQGKRAKIVFWHAMAGQLSEALNLLVNGFNISQSDAEVTAIFKGTYPETLTAAIAAFRAGEAPHLVQVFEVGTASMMAAGKAVKQVWELAKETGVGIDPAAYVPAIRGYYSLPDGRMASLPFNSSTALMWYNKDQFEKAGLDPEKPPATWPAVIEACRTLKARNAGTSATWAPMTTSWPSWIQLEEFSAIHNLPYASKENGFAGLDAELKYNGPGQVKTIQRLLDAAKDGLFRYGGRDNKADDLFPAGEAAIAFNSSGSRGQIARTAKFRWAPALLPYDPDVIAKPINSIIGGASLWTMTAPSRTPEEYRGAAAFLKFLGEAENDARWHQQTGYVPVTMAGFALSKQQGFYDKNPGADLPYEQLNRGTVTINSKGIRLGRMPELRNIFEEEFEKALQGQQNGKQALDTAVTRGNKVLRDFQRSVKG